MADHRYQYLGPLRSTLSIIAYPVYYLTGLPSNLARKVWDYLAGKEDLRRRNRSLYRDNLVLKARLQRFEALEAENIRLRDLLGSSLKVGDRVLIAELMAVDLDLYRQQVVVNRGATSGVFVGQPVLDANAVMGQVTRVDPLSATVLLITDASHGLPVQINRNGLRTVARGMGLTNRLELSHLPRDTDVQTGDLVVTSGLGGHFPPGYPVARVVEVRQDPGELFASVIAEPAARLDSNREVLLVWTLVPAVPDQALTKDAGEEVREAP